MTSSVTTSRLTTSHTPPHLSLLNVVNIHTAMITLKQLVLLLCAHVKVRTTVFSMIAVIFSDRSGFRNSLSSGMSND